MNHLSVRVFRYAAPAFGTLFLLVAPLQGQGDAASLYKTKCAACHATDGKGDTPAGKKLGVRDLASPEVQKETDQELIDITTKGKNKMPAFGNSLKDAQIKDLVAYIRDLAKK
jgi:cytochrome c6